jgi:predicted nicotinamide N-methyase
MPSIFSIVIALSFLYLFAYDYVSIVSSLSTAAPVPVNHNVIRSYTFDDETICLELLSPSSSVLDHQHEEEEDEVEYWYPTNRRYFEFSIPSLLSTKTTTTSDNDPSPTPISIRQTSFGCGKLGYELWDSSIGLCLHLGKHNLAKTSSRVLELGSGVGLPSVVCRDVFKVDAILATDFWETDDDVFDEDRLVPTKFHGMNLHYNVVDQQQQGQKEISNNDDDDDDDNNIDRVVETAVLKLDWYDPESTKMIKTAFRPDLIIGSDLVYYPKDVEPLLNTLEILLLQDDDEESSSSSSPPGNKTNTRAVLVLPLAPSEREAIPEFRSKLPARFSATHTVNINELDFLCDQDSEEKSTFLTIDIIPKK